MHDLREELESGVLLAEVEHGLVNVGREWGGEDMGTFELRPKPSATGLGAHKGDEDLATIAIGEASGLLGSTDGFAITGVIHQ